MKISDCIRYIGVNDHEIELFEGQYLVPDGMAYNSYVILDEQITVMDTVDVHFVDQWLSQLEEVLEGRKPAYLIIHHMEPDHSAGLEKFAEKYPDTTFVGSAKTFDLIRQFFGNDLVCPKKIVKEKDTLSLGKHELTFITAPMVHWPEVIMSYEKEEKTLFSADAFGKFGAVEDDGEEWGEEARHYYIGIVGKYGTQVQAVLKKAAALDIQRICPLHGPVLDGKMIPEALEKYQIWSSYGTEMEGVLIAYTSVYGHTREAVKTLQEMLLKNGCPGVKVYDLARDDMTDAIGDAFAYGKVVFATTTYNATIFPPMKDYLNHLTERNFQNRTVAVIENGSWAPTAAKEIAKMLEQSKNLNWLPTVTIRSAMTEENKNQMEELAKQLS